jgi:hypothetical protein
MMNYNDIEDEIDVIRDKMCRDMAGMTKQERDSYLDQPFQAAAKKFKFHVVTPEQNVALRYKSRLSASR